MKIYVASSWRNDSLQPTIVMALRRCGHEVYDFRSPTPGESGFRWKEVGPDRAKWTAEELRRAFRHPTATAGHRHDMNALEACEACVLVLPAGRSASWELGYAMARGKRAAVVMFSESEPELMYRGAEILGSLDELFDAFAPPGFELSRAALPPRFPPRRQTCL